MGQPEPSRVSVRNLAKSYGAVVAAADVSLELGPAQILGLLGPNGAGKTTTLECILGLRAPDSGCVLVDGVDVAREPVRARSRLGAVIQGGLLPDRMTPLEAVGLFGAFHGASTHPGELLRRFGLGEKAGERFGSLSAGQRQRVLLALAFVHNPDLLVLDEPTAGLDPGSRRELHELVRGARASGCAVLLSTHDLGEAEQLCDRVAILDRGRVVALGTPRDLVGACTAPVRIEFRASAPLALDGLRDLPGVRGASARGASQWIEADDAALALGALARRLGAEGSTLVDLQVHGRSLEDVFLGVTGRPWEREP